MINRITSTWFHFSKYHATHSALCVHHHSIYIYTTYSLPNILAPFTRAAVDARIMCANPVVIVVALTTAANAAPPLTPPFCLHMCMPAPLPTAAVAREHDTKPRSAYCPSL